MSTIPVQVSRNKRQSVTMKPVFALRNPDNKSETGMFKSITDRIMYLWLTVTSGVSCNVVARIKGAVKTGMSHRDIDLTSILLR